MVVGGRDFQGDLGMQLGVMIGRASAVAKGFRENERSEHG